MSEFVKARLYDHIRSAGVDVLLDRMREHVPTNIEEIASGIAARILDNVEKRMEVDERRGTQNSDHAVAIAALRNFLDGVVFAYTSGTTVYEQVAAEIVQEKDPEYQEYLRLKEKFGNR